MEKHVNAPNSDPKRANPMWGGHFEQGPSAILSQINQSIAFDYILYQEDIEASIAHCTMLIDQGIVSKEDGEQIKLGLASIRKEIEEGVFQFDHSLEDIHMNVESRLKALIGDAAGRLHTARSRNDQVAVDFRLWVRKSCDRFEILLKDLQAVLIRRAEEEVETIMPGFTHLQTAQPVTLGHHLLAYVEMFGRDRARFRDARKRMNESPLGSAALAGTSFPIDRHKTASLLGFDCPTVNSLDSVSDRDFALEYLAVLSISAMHMSRFAEELVMWASSDFKFITLSDAFTTGSSIMPQKRNPDAAELVRAKSGRITGALVTLLTVMKGLPLTYSKDMQEDKEPVFDATKSYHLCVLALTGMLGDVCFHHDKLRSAADRGFSTATDLADWLVQHLNIPFRQAHHITGRIVQIAEQKQCQLSEVSLAEMQSIEKRITKSIFDVLTVEKSVASRQSFGGTSPVMVANAIKVAKEKYL